MKNNINEVLNHYIVYENGDIYDKDREKYVNVHKTDKGYYAFYCKEIKSDMLVHRFVMYYFNPISNMYEMRVNHKDGNKCNNNISNLEWCDCSYNLRHAFVTKLKTQTGEKNSNSKLSEEAVKEIIELLLSGYKVVDIAQRYDVCHQAISNIKMHKTWTYLTDNIDFPNIKKSKVKSSTTIPLVTGM